MTIWLAGDPEDLTAAYIGWLAGQRDINVRNLREDRFGLDWSYAIDRRGRIQVMAGNGETLPMATGVFVRLNPQPAVAQELGIEADGQPIYVQERRSGLQYLLNTLSCAVINRPAHGRANGAKPVQMAQLAAAGFRVPQWVATNDPERARTFLAQHKEGAIVKSCSGLRSHVRRAELALLAHLESGTAPVLLQRYVAGHDVRVHVVERMVFATQVEANAIDYRFDTEEVQFAAVQVKNDLAERCVTFAAAQGVILAGFDFRVDREGTWWCLEMNPVPTFLPYEAAAGQPIGDAILNLLAPDSPRETASSPLLRHIHATATPDG